MQRALLYYVKSIQSLSGPKPVGTGPSDLAAVTIAVSGYLELPLITKTDIPKKAYEQILRSYLSHHYCESMFILSVLWKTNSYAVLASGRKSKHVPYGQLGQDITHFVSEDFLPTGI